MRSMTTRALWMVAVLLALTGCGEKKTELGQGGSVVTGSAGPAGASNAARELVRCEAPVATLALAENPNGYTIRSGYSLPPSPVPLVKLLAQQSGWLRAAILEALSDRMYLNIKFQPHSRMELLLKNLEEHIVLVLLVTALSMINYF